MQSDELSIKSNHQQAIQAMADYDLYDNSSDKEFEPILKLAQFITSCSISFISFVNKNWESIRFTKGMPQMQLPTDKTFCKIIIDSHGFVEIEDISKDSRVENLFANQFPSFLFYAGIPLIDKDGEVIGTLCVGNQTSKHLNSDQIEAFEALAIQVMSNLELRRVNLLETKNLKKSEEFVNLFNSSPDLILMLDENQEILTINDAVEDIFGYTEKEFKGLNISNFIIAEDRKDVVKLATANLKKKLKKLNIETRIITKNKSIKWISWNAITKNRIWFVSGRDITKERESRQQLHQLSTVASKINNGVVISDPNSNVIWINNAFTKITGYKLDDLESQKLGDVIIGANSNIDIIEKARQETQNKKSFSVELLAYRKDGAPIWLSIFNTIILDNKGEIESLIEIVIDITERKHAEERLELLSLVASKTENGVSISDKTGRVKWINSALEKLFEYTFKELEGKRIGDIVRGSNTDFKKLNEARADARRHLPYDIELEVYKKDGTPVWVSVSNTPIYDDKGNIEREVEIINDITERKKAEEQLIESKEQALQLSKAKEMFLSVMSHEIRTPLNAVIGLTNILLEEEKLAHQEQNLDLLKFSSDNLLSLINDILDFTKIEVGKMELEKKGVNIGDLVRDISDSLSFKVKEKGIEIKHFIDPGLPTLVRGDKTRLYQILINLLNNAIKFTEKGFVKISVCLVSVEEDFTTLHFEISDTGIGIPEDKFDYIFELFTQAESNTTRKYGGTGLGLSIAKRLIELFDGEIKLNSKVGEGTMFYFDLRFNNFKDLSIEKVNSSENQKIMMNAKVLVVDDNEINRILANKILSKFGIEVVFAESGEEAIEIITQDNTIDLVLMDIYMPGISGYEATKRLRSIDGEYYQKLPIIALTASILNDDIETIYNSGMTDHQLKPYKPDDLIAAISKYVNKS
nr:PAS domain S-box protein [Pseudopedobacter sp.]